MLTASRTVQRFRDAMLGFLGLAGMWLAAPDAAAQNYETPAAQAILIDLETGTTLFQKEPDAHMAPANMAKLMTMAVVFDAIKAGRLSLDDEFVVSEHAWRTGGAPARTTTMFAALGSSIRVEDLIRGVIIQSANDGCIVLAEGMAGSEAGFAAKMNEYAGKLGLTHSHFTNPTGLPDPAQYMSARDIAKLTEHLIRDFPEYYKIYSEPEFTWNKIRQLNRNPLLSMNIGADGLTTGSTDESGFGVVGSAVSGGQRLLMVINGAPSEKARDSEARKLFDWGFHEFERVELFGNDEVIAEARVFNGETSHVGLVSHGPVEFLMPLESRDLIKAEAVYQGPLPAPVKAGVEVGILRVTSGDMTMEAPVFTGADVGVGPLQSRAIDGLRELLLGWW